MNGRTLWLAIVRDTFTAAFALAVVVGAVLVMVRYHHAPVTPCAAPLVRTLSPDHTPAQDWTH